jgi:hypothetical protein
MPGTAPLQRPADKGKLLYTLHAAFAELEGLLAGVPKEHRERSGTGDQWTLKDTLAHIVYWQESLADRIEAVLHDRPIDPPPGAPQADVDRLNEQAVAQSRRQTWDEVHAGLQNSFRRIVQLVEALDETDLFAYGRFAAIDHAPLWQTIADETYDHYNEHIDFCVRGSRRHK